MATHSMQRCIALCAMVGMAFATTAYTNYGSCDSFAAEKVNEGWCPHRYQDSLGIWTIGVGFNLEQTGAESVLTGCGGSMTALNDGPNNCNYAGVGSQVIDDGVAQCLLGHYLSSAASCVQTALGSSFNSVSKQVVSGMVDMAYNMGCAGLNEFKTMISQVKSGQYTAAATSAQTSTWCKQVGSRCTRTTACLANGGSSSQPVTPPPVTPPPAGGCFTFQSGLCPGTSDCMCTVGASCGSKLSTSEVHNTTEIIESRRKVAIAQGKAGSCADIGGTCYTVIHGQCPGASTCLAAGAKCG